jgi:hypothetical protein
MLPEMWAFGNRRLQAEAWSLPRRVGISESTWRAPVWGHFRHLRIEFQPMPDAGMRRPHHTEIHPLQTIGFEPWPDMVVTAATPSRRLAGSQKRRRPVGDAVGIFMQRGSPSPVRRAVACTAPIARRSARTVADGDLPALVRGDPRTSGISETTRLWRGRDDHH